jgi:hypothetical protein
MDSTQKRFALGVLLAWAPWVPTLIGVGYAFRAVSNSKATGIGAIAGGFGEILVYWGIAAMLVTQVLAIVWLWRSFSREKMLNNLVGAVSIAMSGLTLLATGFFVWTTWSLP